jgi:hypothetical protein
MTWGDPIGDLVISVLDSTPYVGVVSGLRNPIMTTENGPAWVAILALPGLSTLSLRTGLTAV